MDNEEKYVVYLFTNDGIEKIAVSGKPLIDLDGVLRFGRDNFVFSRGSWNYYKKE